MTLAIPPAVHDFLASLKAGSIVAQLDDGSVAVCSDEDEADRLILASRTANSNKRRTARTSQQSHSGDRRRDA